MLADTEQRIRFARLMADGLQTAGKWRAAFDQYLCLLDGKGDDRGLVVAGPSWLARRDRWLWGRLRSIRDQADDKAKAEIERVLADRLKDALESRSLNELRNFVDHFTGFKAADAARHELIRRLIESGHAIEAEMLLWPEWQSSDPAVAGPAVAQMAELLEQAKDFPGTAACYQRLEREFADVVCRDGKTGKQLRAARSADSEVYRLLNADSAWPSGQVQITKRSVSTGVKSWQQLTKFELPRLSESGPFFSGLSISRYLNDQTIRGYDQFGRESWRISPLPGRHTGNFMEFRNTAAAIQGHLLLVKWNSAICGLDPTKVAGADEHYLWVRNLNDVTLESVKDHLAGRFDAADFNEAYNGLEVATQVTSLGPVSSRYVCFQRPQSLVAIDPLSGETLWVRQDIPGETATFGDDEYVFAAVAPNEALVLRAENGELVGKREIPNVDYEHRRLVGQIAPAQPGEYAAAWRCPARRTRAETADVAPR